MGSIIVGKCQCQCYINYISCEYKFREEEIITVRSNNKSRSTTQKKSTRKSASSSTERQSQFSSTRNPSRKTRSQSQTSIYLNSEHCNVRSDESATAQIQHKPKFENESLKARKNYKFDYVYTEPQPIKPRNIEKQKQQNKLEQKRIGQANQYQQLFFH